MPGRALLGAWTVLMASHAAFAATTLCPDTSHIPPVTTSLEEDESLGALALTVNGGFRIFSDGCFLYPDAFKQSRLNFKAHFLAGDSDATPTPNFLGVTMTLIVGDVHPEWSTPNTSVMKVSRNTGWYRVDDSGAHKDLTPLPDTRAASDVDAWNQVHSLPQPSLKDLDHAIGAAWHAQVGDSSAEQSYSAPRLWVDTIPALGTDQRYIVANDLIRFSGQDVQVPFYGNMFDRTELFIVRFFFGDHETIHQIVLCRTTCGVAY